MGGSHVFFSKNITSRIPKVSRRTTSTRLRELCKEGLIAEISTGPKDPQKVFVSKK